eukprot:CAMPEP_0184480454 /NCGR_PEP_ID=MMETSP0113_2-20130426/1966_1 /TAXON_ID=91329 /ORGANISM="Norrisiella sphaerica, Strain BC52" /LENGTH=199 /DNA_ID=CAMNT_0026858951 /DNA_START=197 /DNA_END=793 /DNA_ORIENTATION=+
MLLFFLVFGGFAVRGESPPKFCHGIDCPKYMVNGSVDGSDISLEVRSYPGALWASTDIKANDQDKALQTGFMRLFNYISGQNRKSQKIDMTSPVMCRVKEIGQGPFCNTTFTVSFFVPFEHQGDAPEPSADNVYLDKVSDRTVAVLQGSGFWMQNDVLKYVGQAGDLLKQKEIAFNDTTYTFSGYDPPFRLFNRHNEIW